MANTKDIGEISEGIVIAEFLRAGLTVLTPFGDNKRYDLVVEEGGRFYRIQTKTARFKDEGQLVFDTCSSYSHRGKGKRSYRGDIDLFAAYSPDLDQVFLVPVNSVGTSLGVLRTQAPKNGQKKNIRWACDYEFTGSFPS